MKATAKPQRAIRATDPDEFVDPEPEDRGAATLSKLGEVEYIADLIRPGRITVVAGEEGCGKSCAATELAIRVAAAGGSFAGTWPVLQTGPVLMLSEGHPDDDYEREERVLRALGLDRSALTGRYYRLSLHRRPWEAPALQDDTWLTWLMFWALEEDMRLVVFDTATTAAAVDPWGVDLQAVYRGLREIVGFAPSASLLLVVHTRKLPPGSRGERGIGDALGEWARWSDIALLMERDGPRTKLSLHKRVRHERRIAATRAGGLLVDPVDLGETGTKVPLAAVVAAVEVEPGIGIAALAERLGVGKRTAAAYTAEAESAGLLRRDRIGTRGAMRLYNTAEGPRNRATPRNERSCAITARSPATASDDRATAQQLYIAARSRAARSRPCADEPTDDLLDPPVVDWGVLDGGLRDVVEDVA